MSLDEVLARINALEADPEEEEEGWRDLSHELKDAVPKYSWEGSDDEDALFSLNGYDTRKLWNILSSSQKASINTLQPDTIGKYALISSVQQIQLDCFFIEKLFDEHVTESIKASKDARAMDLLRFYGTFYPVELPKPPRLSDEAVSDTSDASSSPVGSSLVANKIHHNMFTDQHELTFQKFKRFEIGGSRELSASLEDLIKSFGLGRLRLKLMQFLPEALNNFKCVRSFLANCQSPTEALTQTVFRAFLAHLTKRMNDCLGSSANVVIVAGMNPVKLPVKVSEKYMKLQSKKTNTRYTGGPKETVIHMQSDMAIIEGSSEKYKEIDVGEQQQKLFLECKVNVEMKKWQLLQNGKNKSSLTQVAAESMVRYMALKSNSVNSKVLYSILTDCMLLYAVHHEVFSNEYWISRSVSTPEEIVLSICWLYLCSVGQVESNVSEWKWESTDKKKVRDDKHTEGGGSSSRLDSVDEGDEANDDCCKGHEHSGPGGANEEYEMMLPELFFEDDEDEDEDSKEKECEHWQTMFLMENHRKYGTPLPLTKAILSLHNTTREEKG